MSGYRYSALVVDDEESVRKLTVRALDRKGFVCTPACDGTEAARLLSARRYDVIVTDLRMPNGNGYSLATAQLERADRPLIVILTGVMEPRLAQDLLRRGIDDIMFKPVDYEMFAGKLAGLLERREASSKAVKHDPAEFRSARSSDIEARGNVAAPACGLEASERQDCPNETRPALSSSSTVGDLSLDHAGRDHHDRESQPSDDKRLEPTTPTALLEQTAPATDQNAPGTSGGTERHPSESTEQKLSDNFALTMANRPAYITGGFSRLASLLNWRGVGLPWITAIALTLFSGWLWLQVQLLQQTTKAILALEQLGARLSIAENGSAQVVFEPDRRPTGFATLAQVPNLRQVSFARTRISDDDLQALTVLDDLESLDLQQTGITDAGLAHLNALRRLQVLSLRGTRVTNAGIMQLRQLPELREVSLRDTDVTAAGVRTLQSQLPRTKIEHASVAPDHSEE
jgi:DNA-binding response OmpR family regulator